LATGPRFASGAGEIGFYFIEDGVLKMCNESGMSHKLVAEADQRGQQLQSTDCVSEDRASLTVWAGACQLREQQLCDCFGRRLSDLSRFGSERRSNVHD